jgi:hypothetical protein
MIRLLLLEKSGDR